MNKKLGFTLVELVVSMAIIAILASALWGNFFSSLNKGRDSRRKQDLEGIVKAVELYYNDNKNYPQPTQIVWGSAFTHSSNTSVIYMQKVPNDPSSPTNSYCYAADAAGSYYKLYAKLENKDDPKVIPTIACPPAGSTYYNYGISSSNTTP